MNIEEIKIAIRSAFAETESPLVKMFLDNVVKPRDVISSNKGLEYRPVFFKDTGLTAYITYQFGLDKNNQYHSHYNVMFQELLPPPSDAVLISVDNGYPCNDETGTQMIVDGDRIRVQRAYPLISFDDSFNLEEAGTEVEAEIIFDIINRRVSATSDKYTTMDEIFCHIVEEMGQVLNNDDDWLDEVKKARERSPSFAEAYRLFDIDNLSRKPEVTIKTLYAYCVQPSVAHLLSHSVLGETFRSFVYNNLNVDGLSSVIKSSFFPGNNVYEVLGIDKRWEEAITFDKGHYSIEDIINFNNELSNLEKVISVPSASTLKKIMRIANLSFEKTDALSMGRLKLLTRMGHDIDKLYDYLLSVQTHQGIKIEKGFGIYFEVFYKNYILTGETDPIFPEYLRVKEDIQNSIFEDITTSNSVFGANFSEVRERNIKFQGELTGKYLNIEVFDITNLSMLDLRGQVKFTKSLSIKRIGNNAGQKQKEYVVKLLGDAILSVTGSIPKDMEDGFNQWVRHHQLFSRQESFEIPN